VMSLECLPDAADEAVVALDTAGNQGRRVHSEVDIATVACELFRMKRKGRLRAVSPRPR